MQDLGAALQQVYATFMTSSHSSQSSIDVTPNSNLHKYDLRCRSTISEALAINEVLLGSLDCDTHDLSGT